MVEVLVVFVVVGVVVVVDVFVCNCVLSFKCLTLSVVSVWN